MLALAAASTIIDAALVHAREAGLQPLAVAVLDGAEEAAPRRPSRRT